MNKAPSLENNKLTNQKRDKQLKHTMAIAVGLLVGFNLSR